MDGRIRLSEPEEDDELEDGRHVAKRTVQLRPENGLAYFEDLGWRTLEVESLFEAAHRFHRLPMLMRPIAWLPQTDPRRPGGSPWSTGCTPYPLSSANG